MNDTICKAIRERKLLMFGYADVVRVVEPHAYGMSTADHEMMSAWLLPGHSRSNPEGGWRNYLVDQIRGMQVLDQTFDGPRPGYNPDDKRLQQVFCRLQQSGVP